MEDNATYLKMEMADGTEVSLTLTFGRLFRLRQKDKKAYEKYSRIAIDGMKDEFDFITYIYTAYLCANIDSLEGCMDEEEFIGKLPDNHVQLVVLVNKLKFGGMKKKQGSGSLSSGKARKMGSVSPNLS